MYNHNAEKATRVTQTQTTPHYHKNQTIETQLPRKENLKLLAGSLSTLGSLLGEKVWG
jgi:hypothetical protein